MKRVSVAEAKNHLPALLHEAETEPVEIVRRGKPIAVLVSRAAFDRLEGRGDFARAISRFREKHGREVEALGQGIADDLCSIRDRNPGRKVRM